MRLNLQDTYFSHVFLRTSNVPNLPQPHQVVQGFHGLLNGRVVVPSMDLVQIEIYNRSLDCRVLYVILRKLTIDLQTSQTRFDRIKDMLSEGVSPSELSHWIDRSFHTFRLSPPLLTNGGRLNGMLLIRNPGSSSTAGLYTFDAMTI